MVYYNRFFLYLLYLYYIVLETHMRRVLFTESQLKEALGEDFMSYLPNSSMAAEEPDNSYGTEIGTSDKNCDGIETDTITTDKIAQQRSPRFPIWRASTGLHESKKKLNETNQDLTDMGKTFNLGKKLNNSIQQTANDNPNDKMLSNMANDENMTANCAYTRNNRLEHMKHDDPERYKRINGERLQKVLQDKLDNAKGISKSRKETKAAAGLPNAYHKEGGTRNVGNGMAHSQKKDDSVVFSYNT